MPVDALRWAAGLNGRWTSEPSSFVVKGPLKLVFSLPYAVSLDAKGVSKYSVFAEDPYCSPLDQH